MATNNVLNAPIPFASDKGGTGLTSYTAGDTVYYASGTTLSKLGIGAANTINYSTGSAPAWSATPSVSGTALVYNGSALAWTAVGAGTVTSVGLTQGASDFTITNTPITTSGNISITLNTVTTAKGGTGLTSFTAGDTVYYSTGTALSKLTIGAANTVMVSSGTAPAWAGGTAASGNVLTYNGSAVVWASPADQTAWVAVSGTTQAMAVDTGYACNNGSPTTLTLPSTAAFGSEFEVVGPAIWTIAQNAGQSIILGNTTTTVGTGGSLTATNTGDTIRIVCSVANTTFRVLSAVGNITVV